MNNESRADVFGRWRQRYEWLVSTALLAASVTIVLIALGRDVDEPPPPDVPADLLPLTGAPLLGESDAAVAMIVYSDFQCPFCGRLAQDTISQLGERYVKLGMLSIAFRHFPLQRRHQYALEAAQSAECARQQGKFWAMHDRLFELGGRLDSPAIFRAAAAAGVDAGDWTECMKELPSSQIDSDIRSARALAIKSTPYTLIGRVEGNAVRVTQIVTGARPLDVFIDAIEAARTRGAAGTRRP